jgi:2-polyprenyl-3-methyl-5-hydroxy-6-metoxy-1,4-benzoquinol methylase
MSASDITQQEQEERWHRESTFFDGWASETAKNITPVDPMAIARFASPHLHRRFSKEFRFRLMGDLHGRTVLDVGCGEGEDSVLMAKLGATVTGVDISPKSIEVAQKRAAASEVESRTTFTCTPLEALRAEGATFDIIWGKAILHHLIPDLDKVLATLAGLCRPDTLVIFDEPVNLSKILRQVRFCVPVHTDATPDERPLEPQELSIVQAHFVEGHFQYFRAFGRLERFLLTDGNYERSSFPRRLAVNAIAMLDFALLKLPGMRRVASEAVMYGHMGGGTQARGKTDA